MKDFFRVYLRSLRILWTERAVTLALIVAGLVAAVAQLAEPILFGRVIDTLTRRANVRDMLILWGGLGLVNVFVSVFLAVAADRLAHRRRLTIMGEVFERAISLPLSYHAEKGSGRVVRSILTGTDQLFGLWLSFLREHLPALVGILILIPTALAMDSRLAMLMFGLALLYLYGGSFVLRRTHQKQASIEGYHQDVFGRVGDVIGNVTVVQSYTRLVDEMQGLQEIMSRLLRAQYPVLTWWGLLTVFTRVSATLTIVAIIGVGAWLAERGDLSVGEVVAFTGFAGLLIAKLDQLAAFFSRLIAQGPQLRGFFELMDQNVSTHDKPGAKPLAVDSGAIEFRDVSFRYPGKEQGVFGVNFRAEAGQTVALVGPTGSGKSTTVALLKRLFDPQLGQIEIDGQDVRDVSLASLRLSIAAVFQDAGLFNRTVAENIRVGRPSATDEEVREAARRAQAEEFILAKPGGYDFVIGERGASLSGGERQRLAIARAILKNAPILILDEATSALDNETESKIQAAISELRKGRTTLIIAHRLTTVRRADLILVFENGQIVERGQFGDLAKAGGTFSRLLSAGDIEPVARPRIPRIEAEARP